jgi:hypothetical protein
MSKIVNELRKLKKRPQSKSLRRSQATRRCPVPVPVGPFTPNRNTAPRWFTQDQRLDRANTPGLEHKKTLTSKRMEWVTNLSPSQRLVGDLGSSL